MVLISFGSTVFAIHRINYLEESQQQKIHYRMKTRLKYLSDRLLFFSRVKAEFIRAKYQQMAYINRLKDETNSTLEDLNLVNRNISKECFEIFFSFSAITFDRSDG